MDNAQEGIPLPSETAARMLDLGIRVVPLERGAKDPHRKHWIHEEHQPEDVERDFPMDNNIGVLLGPVSANLVDADLDTLEAVRIGARRLPPTGMKWGRKSKPRSHYLYRLPSGESLPKNLVWNDPSPGADGKKARLLELRWHGQTVAPGSINTASGRAEGVRYEADGTGAPSIVYAAALTNLAPSIAAAALVARWWSEGTRHDMALPLAGFLWHGGASKDDARRFMEDVCVGADDDQVDNRLQCVEDTYRNGMNGVPISGATTLEDFLTEAQVRKLREWLGLRAKRSVGILGPDYLPLAGDGDGDRFANRFGGKVLYCALEDQWYIWTETRWERDDVKHIKELAKETARAFRQLVGEKEAMCGTNGIAAFKACAEHGQYMGNEGSLNAMLKEAQSKPEIRMKPEEFDANPRLLNVLNGTLELDPDTGNIGWHSHDAGDKITMVAPVEYSTDPVEAKHPLVEEWLDRFFPELERRDFLLKLAGDTLHGLPKRHGVNLVGLTNSGKSMTLKLFASTLGDYAASLEYTSLMKNERAGGDTPRADLWRVRRKRLVTVSEVPPDTKLDVALFKAILSGGDSTSIRTLYDRSGGRDIQWAMSLWMSGNKPYGPPPSEEAAYERLHVLGCDHQVPAAVRDDRKQRATLDPANTGSAVLALMLEGFRQLYAVNDGHLVEPPSSVEAKSKLVAALDRWSEAIEMLFEFTGGPNDAVLRADAWAFTKEELGITRNEQRERLHFEESLERRGARRTKSSVRWNGQPYWQGVRATEEGIRRGIRPSS